MLRIILSRLGIADASIALRSLLQKVVSPYSVTTRPNMQAWWLSLLQKVSIFFNYFFVAIESLDDISYKVVRLNASVVAVLANRV